jgi:hypothetical protein
MTPADEVLYFSRAYISSKKERTFARKIKIREAYKEVFGKYMRGSCATCFIEAMLEIVKTFKTLNIKTMAINYELKRGVLLQELGHPEKACTNDTMTDELAEWHLSRHPEKAVLFARLPSPQLTFVPPPPEIKIIKPATTVIIPPVILDKEEKIEELKKSLKKNKVELIELAKEKNLPEKEWEDKNKIDLTNYLFETLSKLIE